MIIHANTQIICVIAPFQPATRNPEKITGVAQGA